MIPPTTTTPTVLLFFPPLLQIFGFLLCFYVYDAPWFCMSADIYSRLMTVLNMRTGGGVNVFFFFFFVRLDFIFGVNARWCCVISLWRCESEPHLWCGNASKDDITFKSEKCLPPVCSAGQKMMKSIFF